MVTHHDDQSLVKVTCARCQDTRLIAVAFAAETETEALPVIDLRDEPSEDLGVRSAPTTCWTSAWRWPATAATSRACFPRPPTVTSR